MPLPISDSSVQLVWENNSDTSITSSNLSKSCDYISSYVDFDIEPAPHLEGAVLLTESGNLNLLLKKECLFSIINTAEKNGEKVLSINEHYRLFDIGLEDLRLTFDDMDDNPTNPVNNQSTHDYWGANKEWFLYICDKFDSSLEKQNSDDYGGGAQLLLSQGRLYPIGAVPGDPTRDYSAADTRKIGGFKSNASGYIIPDSVWDISYKKYAVAAKKYFILDEFQNDSEDTYSRHLFRPLRLTDLDSSTGTNNVFEDDVTIKGTFTVKTPALDNLFVVNASTNNVTITTTTLTVTVPTITITSTTSVGITSAAMTFTGTVNNVGTTNFNGSIVLNNGSATINGNLGAYDLTASGNLAVTGTGQAHGKFDAGTTNPAHTDRVNYDGNFYANNILSIANITVGGNLSVSGQTQATGKFDSGTTDPAHTTRLNYDGNLYARNLASIANTTTGTLSITGQVQSQGKFYAGTTNPSHVDRVNYDGNLYITALYTTSTISVKENVTPFMGSAIDIIKGIEVVEYNLKNDSDKLRKVGFIAENTVEMLAGKEHDHMDYGNVIGLILEGFAGNCGNSGMKFKKDDQVYAAISFSLFNLVAKVRVIRDQEKFDNKVECEITEIYATNEKRFEVMHQLRVDNEQIFKEKTKLVQYIFELFNKDIK